MKSRGMTEENKGTVWISNIGNLTHTPPDNVILVEQDADYVQACYRISQQERSGTPLKVWVRSKTHESWLRDFTEQIGCASRFDEKTPRLVLADQWNVALPGWLTDEDVIHHRLLDIRVDTQKPMRFETRFLTHFLGSAFESDALTPGNLASVIKSLVSEDAKKSFQTNPLLNPCLKAKCEQWAERSGDIWINEICGRLTEDFFQVWQWLSLWSALQGYPEKLLEYVLTPDQILFARKVPPEAVTDLPLEPGVWEQALTQIDLIFKEIGKQIASSEDFKKVVGWTSGRFSQEYHLVSSILRSKQFAPNEADIEAVREKFRSCPGVSRNHLHSLRYCVKPRRPGLLGPEENWSGEQWIQWTTKEYLPYRTWQVHNGHYDGEVEQTVARFSDWYIDEYDVIHKDPDLSVIHSLRSISQGGAESDLNIILLVDCLPLSFVEILDNALRNVGLNLHDLQYRFAGLPTITEHNKAALLSGNWRDKPGNYESILKERSVSDWNGKSVVYLSNLKSMMEMAVPQEATIAVLNFVDGDELLHSDVESKNTTYEDELHRLFVRMAEAVNRLSQEWTGPRDQFKVYVVTDHGACRILEEEKRSFDSAVVKKLFADEKHRFSAVSEDRAGEIPENLWALGHRFKRPYGSGNMTYFLPRGHNTVRYAGGLKRYMHGGVTPEEVIVPAALYKLVKAPWKKPAARFLNLDIAIQTGRAKFYVQRVVTLEIEIQNSNATDIRILRATVLSPEAEVKSCETAAIPAGKAKPLKVSCYFKKTALGAKPLEIEIAYEIAGEQHTLPLVLESEFKSAMATGFSLRDL